MSFSVFRFQGGKNFFEKIRTKIRTFSEEIRTIFEKKSVQSVQFSKKKIRTIRTFFEKSVQSVQFSKKIPTIRMIF